MRKLFLIFISLAVLFSCGGNNSNPNALTSGNKVDSNLYKTRPIGGTDWLAAFRDHPNGERMEDGFLSDGIKVGTWTSYYPNDGYVNTISSYRNGVLTGPYMEFDERGRMNKQINYENNIMSGLYAEYKNGRVVRKIQYLNGEIHGYIREYNNQSKLIKEAYYKNNKLDGKVSNYNDDGKLVLEYIYKNGEKISGGIVE